jgi:hypothetical protein
MEVSGQIYGPAALPSGPITHWIGGWGGLEPVWTWCRREKFLASAEIQTPIVQSSSPYSVAMPTELSRLWPSLVQCTTKGFSEHGHEIWYFLKRHILYKWIFTNSSVRSCTTNLIQWVPGSPSLEVKLITPLHLVQRSKNEWSYTCTPTIWLHSVVLI